MRFNQAPLPLSAYHGPKEVIAEASEACSVTDDLCTACVGICGSTQKKPKVTSLSVLLVPDLVQGCIVEEAGPGGRSIVATGIEVAALPPEIWAASLAVFSQDLSAPDLVLMWNV